MNVSASVKDRLLNLSRTRHENFNRLLERFVLERFLYRLSQSAHRDQFVLKGAMLFTVWLAGQPLHRTTRDLDLLGFGPPEPDILVTKFRDILSLVPVEEDGLSFSPSSLKAEPIKEGADYKGTRLLFSANLGSARVPVQVDVGFGDSIYPAATSEAVPTLLGQPTPVLRIYPRETVIAEKLHVILHLGLANSRMKDYFDLRFLSERFTFDGEVLTKAVALTLQRRGYQLNALGQLPQGLSADFSSDASKQQQWAAFLRRAEQPVTPLSDTVSAVRDFLMPILSALPDGPPPGQWLYAGWQSA
jgi:hypothetical protein